MEVGVEEYGEGAEKSRITPETSGPGEVLQ